MSNKQNTEENTHEAPAVDGEQEGAQPEADRAARQDETSVEPREADVESLQEALEEATRQASNNWDKFVRVQAELDNVIKRSRRDLESARKFALEKFASELLVVRDSLEMGLVHTEEIDPDKLKEGSELTLRMLTQVMEKFNVVQIDPEGEPFDPKLHEAVTMAPSDEVEPNCVLNVIQKGYLLNDRLIRPARVVVVKSLDE